MLREATDLLMPRECLVCGRQLGAHEVHLCLWCQADLPQTYYWERPHNPMADEFNAVLERHRPEGAPMAYAYAAALLFYHRENPYRRIPQALKYLGNQAAGRYFAAFLGRRLAAAPHFTGVDAVVPVPLHWLRRRARGYNQAEVIARALAAQLHAALYPHGLRRTRRTRSQTAFLARERLRNVQGVFCVHRLPKTLTHVLLVDDTFTTGATLAACYFALRAFLGPGPRISVATLSVVEG